MNLLKRHRRFRGYEDTERGSSLLALLIVVLILGLMAAVALGGLGYIPNSTITGIPSTMPGGGAIVAATTTTVATKGGDNGARESVIKACRTDYAMVSAAIQRYKKLNGSLPRSGTAWAGDARDGGPFLRAWPRDDKRFVIVWNGLALSVVPVKGAIAHNSIGTSSPATGCFAT
jgi:hypothetical protein